MAVADERCLDNLRRFLGIAPEAVLAAEQLTERCDALFENGEIMAFALKLAEDVDPVIVFKLTLLPLKELQIWNEKTNSSH